MKRLNLLNFTESSSLILLHHQQPELTPLTSDSIYANRFTTFGTGFCFYLFHLF